MIPSPVFRVKSGAHLTHQPPSLPEIIRASAEQVSLLQCHSPTGIPGPRWAPRRPAARRRPTSRPHIAVCCRLCMFRDPILPLIHFPDSFFKDLQTNSPEIFRAYSGIHRSCFTSPVFTKNRPNHEPPQHMPATRVAIEKNRLCHLMSPSIRSLAAPDQNPRRKAWPERLSTRSDAQESRRRLHTRISSATACAMGSDTRPTPHRPVSSPLHSPRPHGPPYSPTAHSLSPTASVSGLSLQKPPKKRIAPTPARHRSWHRRTRPCVTLCHFAKRAFVPPKTAVPKCQRLPRFCCSSSMETNSALKFPTPKPREPCRSITS